MNRANTSAPVRGFGHQDYKNLGGKLSRRILNHIQASLKESNMNQNTMNQNSNPYDFTELRNVLDEIKLPADRGNTTPQVGNGTVIPIESRLMTLPGELRFMIWNLLLPSGLTLQVNPASEAVSIPRQVFQCQQLARLVSQGPDYGRGVVHIRHRGVFIWTNWERIADEALTKSWFQWADSRAENPVQDILNARLTCKFMNEEILKALKIVNIPVMLTAPGIPRLNRLTQWQRNIASVSSTLIVRHYPFRTHEIASYVEENPQINLLLIPPVWIKLDDTHYWDGTRLEEGINLGDSRAYQYLQDLLRDVIPDMRVSETANGELRWVGEVLVSMYLPAPRSQYQTMRCLVAKDVGHPAKPLFIMGVKARLGQLFSTPKSSHRGLMNLARRYRLKEQTVRLTQDDPRCVYRIAAKDFFKRYYPETPAESAVAENNLQASRQQAFDSWYDTIPVPARNLNLWFDRFSKLGYYNTRI